jgi:cyclin L
MPGGFIKWPQTTYYVNFRTIFMSALPHVSGEGSGRLSMTSLLPTPSFVDGVSGECETELRIYACELIQQAGFLLQLHQVTTATGQVLLQRFYHNESMKAFDVRFVAMGALFLASKVEENMRSPRQVLSVFYHLLQPGPPLEVASQLYWDLKEGMFQAEMHILRTLGFHTSARHPHKFLLMYARALSLPPEVIQVAWNAANDSLKTSVVIRWMQMPWVVASACIYFAARRSQLSLPADWHILFDSSLDDMLEIIGELAELYSRSSPAKWSLIPGARIPFGFDQVC